MKNSAAGSESGVVLQVTCSDFREGIRELRMRNINTTIEVLFCVHYRTQG